MKMTMQNIEHIRISHSWDGTGLPDINVCIRHYE